MVVNSRDKRGKSDKSESKKSNNYVLSSLFENDPGVLEEGNDEEGSESSDNNCATNDDDQTHFKTLRNEANKSVGTSCSNSKMIRVYCKERPPVGIPVIEHLEVNVCPLSIKLTNSFYKMMMKYFFDTQNQPTANNANFRTTDPNQDLKNKKNRHAYHKSATEEQLNSLLQLNLSNNNNPVPVSPVSIDSPTNIPSSSSSNLQVLQSPTNLKHILQNKPNQTSNNNTFNQQQNNKYMSTGNVVSCIESKGGSGPGVSAVATAAMVTSNTTAAVLLQLTSSQSNLQQTSNNNNNNLITNNPNNNSSGTSSSTTTTTNSTGNSQQLQNSDVEIMKQRSANNNTFLCIKIPEIQMLVSFKANNKDKNIKDLNEVSLLFPLFEVHDQTWTWLDLIDAIKSHVKKALVSQALKHKLIKVPIQPVNKLINRTRRSHSQQHLTNLQIEENEQMTILKLFGTKFIEKKSQSSPMQQLPPAMPQFHLQPQVTQAGFSSMDEIRQTETQMANFLPYPEKPLVSLTKQNSSVSLSLKRRFFKFGREKEAKELSESEKNKWANENKRRSAPK